MFELGIIPTLNFKLTFDPYLFHFKRPSGTSRGVLTEKRGWIFKLTTADKSIVGLGECSIIPGLSPDFISIETYEAKLREVCSNPILFLKDKRLLAAFPSILFGLESAYLDWKNGGKQLYFSSDFTLNKKQIPINGLIWMGDAQFMADQIEEKIEQGYSCIKMKVGAIDFNTELKLLENIRKRFSVEQMILRVDANGAFAPTDALEKLHRLSELKLHSIEQPIMAGNWQLMKQLCAETPLPIALDEELIGINEWAQKEALLTELQPQFIILKPSLHGGLSGTSDWIKLAQQLNIPWWMTSALESNIGLKTIAQFTALFNNDLPQGLGTGSLYETNFETDLTIQNGFMTIL